MVATNKLKNVCLWCKSKADLEFCIALIEKTGILTQNDCWVEEKLYLVSGQVPEDIAWNLISRPEK